MPLALRRAGTGGAAVPLFWPTAQEGARAAADAPWDGFFARIRGSAGFQTLQLAFKVCAVSPAALALFRWLTSSGSRPASLANHSSMPSVSPQEGPIEPTAIRYTVRACHHERATLTGRP